MSTTNILDLNNRIDELEKNSGGGGSADSAKRSDIATEFNTTTSYTAGCFVYHEGKLYQFNADHAAGAWDPTDVVEANVTDQIVSNKAAIEGLTANVKMTKLWENPSPTASFAAQNITLASDDYDFLIILYNWTTSSASSFSTFVQKNHNFELTATLPSTSGTRTASRSGSYNSTTEAHFGECLTFATSSTTDNDRCIPIIIYGIKLT